MKFSVIIVSLNPGEKLIQTVRSALSQKDADIEIIIKDGGSKDGSLGAVRELMSDGTDTAVTAGTAPSSGDGADHAKMDLYEKLFERAAFLSVTLQRLEAKMISNGLIENYQNGANQSGRKKSSESGLYIDFQKLFLSTMKELRTVFGNSLKHEPDEFELFMMDHGPRNDSQYADDDTDDFDQF